MAQGQETGGRLLVPQAKQAMDSFKYEVARELNITPPQGGYWGNMPARDCGAVGGHMVRRMIQIAEQSLSGRVTGPGGAAR
ncbi:MAG: alpha/beta-type small acid-soluble spore protein [Firmicutes bacterium]|nr:alpha/beta-type small acid-soluble spore protein [Bacillota bacterium]MCL5038314.1 alpha/beta-type small acid-soluble spore protein [Bacillota bacterium]